MSDCTEVLYVQELSRAHLKDYPARAGSNFFCESSSPQIEQPPGSKVLAKDCSRVSKSQAASNANVMGVMGTNSTFT